MHPGVATEIASLKQQPHVITTTGGDEYIVVPEGWRKDLAIEFEPPASPLAFATLSGLRDYLMANRDGLDLSTHVLHVESHESVALLSSELGYYHTRQRWAVASVPMTKPMVTLGQFSPLESFNIWLQTAFVQTDSLRDLLRVTGTVKHNAVLEATDDGVTQAVAARKGVHLAAEVAVPNPVMLAPYRTFREVEQPISAFVLRLKSGPEGGLPTASLFEADGGQWRLDAMETIGRWLRTNVPDTLVVLV